MFARAQVTSGNFVSPGTYTKIDLHQTTSLKDGEEDGEYFFTAPTAITENDVRATNTTSNRQTLAIGFLNNNEPNPVLVFQNVGKGNSVEAEFTPTLKIYATSDYQENEILRADVQTQEPIWTKNIATLDTSTTLQLSIDAATGAYILQ
jgi:hypothetical protein